MRSSRFEEFLPTSLPVHLTPLIILKPCSSGPEENMSWMLATIICSIVWSLRKDALTTAVVTLTPANVTVTENGQLDLNCTSDDTTNVARYSSWNFQNFTGVILGVQNNTCDPFAPFNNTAIYSYSCKQNNTFVLTILQVNASQHNGYWQCFINLVSSNKAYVHVQASTTTNQTTTTASTTTTGTTTTAKGDNPEPCKRRCWPCWVFVTISSGFSLVTIHSMRIILVLFNKVDDVKIRPRTTYRIGITVVLTAQIAVILASGLCKEEKNCDVDICVPCWVYCLSLTIITITCIPLYSLVKDLVKKKQNMYWTSLGIMFAVYIAVPLSAAYCKARSTPADQIHSWIYYVTLSIILFTMTTLAAILRGCCKSVEVGRLSCWEPALCIGVCFFVTAGIAFTILAGHFRNSIDTGSLLLAHWEIHLIVDCTFVICWTITTFIYIVREPVSELRVKSKRVTVKTMEVLLQWKCRLSKYKTFYVQLEQNSSRLSPEEAKCRTMDHEEGIMQYTLTKLKLDTNYKIRVYSLIFDIPSLETEIQIDTNAPLPEPTDLRVVKKTDTSLTLSWKQICGRATNYVIECRKAKTANKTVRIYNSKETTYTIMELKPKTTYTIEVYAENKTSKSTKASIVERTRAPKPEPPSDFKFTSVNEEDIVLQWKPCQHVNKQKFCLTYISDGSRETELINYDGNKVMEHTVSGLDPGTDYMFDLTTKVGKRTSESSAVLSVTTKGIRKDTSSNKTNVTTMFQINSQNGQWTKHV